MLWRILYSFAVLMGLLACIVFFPLLCSFGGSVQVWNWGPGLLGCGLVVASHVFGSHMRASWGWDWHFTGIVGVLAVLGWKAASSPIASAGGHDLVLIGFVLAGYLIGRVQDARRSHALMLGLLAGVACNATVAVIQWSVPEWNPIYPGRPGGFSSGFFAHYNHAANFGLGSAGLFLSALLRGKGISKAFSGFGLAASLLMVLLSLSRGGILALACVGLGGLILFFARLKHRGSSPLLLWAGGVTGCLVIGPLVSLAVQRVAAFRGNGVREGGFSDGGRLSFYDAAWKLFLEHPVTGGGAGSFGRDVYQVLPVNFNLMSEPGMAHNEALQLLVDYGAPCALMLVLLLIAPILRQCTRYQLGRSSGGGAWEALGLLGMLIQSNFDFVFHVAPCAFLAALILGRICRQRRLLASGSEWDQIHGVSRLRAEEYYEEARAAETQGDEAFTVAVRSYACASLAGRKRAEFRLIVLLLSSKHDHWQRHGNDLILREKMRDVKGMTEAMRRIVEDCGSGEVVGRQGGGKRDVAELTTQSGWGARFRSLMVMVAALVLVAAGTRLTEFSLALWMPVYHPNGMSPARRFEILMLVQEKAPFLGIERKALDAFIEQLYEFSSLEAREFWATSSYRRLLRGSVAAEDDPVVALQLATVAGWAGEEEQALALYDRAIQLQAVHEPIFMAYFFKAEYFHDLMLSSADEGKAERSRGFAVLASENFKRSLELAPFGGAHHRRRLELMGLCDQALSAGNP